MMKLILIGQKLNLDIKMNLYFSLQLYKSLCMVNLRPGKVLACLDPQYRIVIQCQNIVHVLNEHEKVLKELTDSTECNINDSQNDIIGRISSN